MSRRPIEAEFREWRARRKLALANVAIGGARALVALAAEYGPEVASVASCGIFAQMRAQRADILRQPPPWVERGPVLMVLS